MPATKSKKPRTFHMYDVKGGDRIMVDGRLVEVYDTTIAGTRSQYVDVRYFRSDGAVEEIRTNAYSEVRVYDCTGAAI